MRQNIEHVESQITDWLKGEHKYQFYKNLITHTADPQLSVDYLLSQELESKWRHFQLFNESSTERPEDTIRLQANQRLLKTVAGARAALVWSYVLDGVDFNSANDQTWSNLQTYYGGLRKGNEPYPDVHMAHKPLAEVVQPATLAEGQDTAGVNMIFRKIAGLALVHFASQDSFILPAPGVASGSISYSYGPTI